ncbi:MULTISPECIES: hypothetical protein [Mycolicibacterium]|uniref:hypothetical protein n=1 Tax=Mycolicibacterium TaxID=1866885 RepID=UPI0014906C95|nr:hypothetical protein [Mycolicibacterium fortuitum]
MLTTVFGKTADLLDKRFLVGLLLPSLGFCATVAALVLIGLGWPGPLRYWTDLPLPGRWAIAAVIAAAVLLVAVLLGTQVNRLVAFWEGYYWPKWFSRVGACVQRRRFNSLGDDDWSEFRRLQHYPSDPSTFLPTKLGNVFLAAENYSRERYGLDSVYLWPRLYLSVPTDVRAILDDARRAVDQLVVIATAAVLSVLAALGLGLVGWQFDGVTAPSVVWGPAAAVAAAVAFGSYRSAVSAAVGFGDLVRSVFDLYRGELLAKLGVPAPRTREIEKQTWEALGQFLFRGGSSDAGDALIEFAVRPEEPRSLTVSYKGRSPKSKSS